MSKEIEERVKLLRGKIAQWIDGYKKSKGNGEGLPDYIEAFKDKIADMLPSVNEINKNGIKVSPTHTATATQPPTKTEEHFDAADKAAEIGAEMTKQQHYQKGYAGPEGLWYDNGTKRFPPGQKLPAKYKDTTWCNRFAFDLAEKTLGENSPFKDMNINMTSAKGMNDYFNERNDLFEEVGTFEKAWEEANKGKMVFLSDSGHVATCVPTDKMETRVDKSGKSWTFGKVVQAGASVGTMYLNHAWSVNSFSNIEVFVTKNNGEGTTVEVTDQPQDASNNNDQSQETTTDTPTTSSTLTASVGKGGTNKNEDVRLIQTLLNSVRSAGLVVDGLYGNNTLGAIMDFQKSIFNGWADGLIEVGQTTWKKLSGSGSEPQNNDSDDNNSAPPTSSDTLTASVGKGGNNKNEDVSLIQTLLNKVLNANLVVDGLYGNNTLGAIMDFQKSIFNGWADGLIEVGQTTWEKLSGQNTSNDSGGGDNTHNDSGNDDDNEPNDPQDDYDPTGDTEPAMLSDDAINAMHLGQKLSNNCDETSRMMVYRYLDSLGLVDMKKETHNHIYDEVNHNEPYFIDNILTGGGRVVEEGHMGMVRETVDKKTGKKTYVQHPEFSRAIKYIDKYLNQDPPIPLVVGVSHTNMGGAGYNEGTTDHFIVIVGKGKESGSKAYYYIDPARAGNSGKDIARNVMVQNKEPGKEHIFYDPASPMGNSYTLTNVAVFQKDRKEEDKDSPIKEAQRMLDKLGFDPNGIDGKIGPSTKAATEAFQQAHGLSATGNLDDDTIEKLKEEYQKAGH